MQDLDSLIDEAISSGQEAKANENQKPPVAVYQRKKKNGGQEAAAVKPAAEKQAVVEQEAAAPKLTTAELKAKLNSRRQEQIQNRKKKATGANKSTPLTPIYFCDAPNCTRISDGTTSKPMCCSTCSCFCYCSRECQLADWPKHKAMCGRETTPEGKLKLNLYKTAWAASESLYNKVKNGDYITVLHEPGNVPASMYASIAEKSNVLNWREYIKNPLFTTSALDSVGDMAPKIQAAINNYPEKKVFMISVILDRLRDNETTECVIRLFLGGDGDSYGVTMDAPTNGKITKTVARYTRKSK